LLLSLLWLLLASLIFVAVVVVAVVVVFVVVIIIIFIFCAGLAERMNWLKVPVERDPFGARVLAAGIPAATIKEWSVDPQVKGKSVFDSLEDTDSDECVKRLVALNAPTNSAFVFIKPHANTNKVQTLVAAEFGARG
jgi:hypothetical protein